MTRSAVVLVGGEARRANGLEKYFFTFGGRTFIERLTESLKNVVDEIVLVAKDPAQCQRFSHLEGVRCVTDIRRGYGPIGGLHAGTLAASGEALFVCACDMPCVSTQVVDRLFLLLGDYDAVIPRWNPDMIEPLHAVYLRSALLVYLENHESLSLRKMVQGMHARYVDIQSIQELDPELKTFTNINKIEDLDRLS
ncbi:MAG: molybdenum cofactor guanylyltransferase [Methanolinea sp.]|jgi:molybdopterin-guanine dinucleotide biosynthesis protein A|nr:molybdenum cofactor guanylyltransferase [Methanolinea sp.]